MNKNLIDPVCENIPADIPVGFYYEYRGTAAPAITAIPVCTDT